VGDNPTYQFISAEAAADSAPLAPVLRLPRAPEGYLLVAVNHCPYRVEIDIAFEPAHIPEGRLRFALDGRSGLVRSLDAGPG
jgi:hypothetical protein